MSAGGTNSAVLVAYASTYGSTREVAEAIAARLADRGISIDIKAAGDVRSLEGYDAVVFGGALYFFRLIREGRRFLARHRKALATVPFAAFGMGPIEDTPGQFEGARAHLDKSLAGEGRPTPAAVAVFGGVSDPDALRFPHANPAMRALGRVDLRDWDVIAAWADSLPEALDL